MCAFFFFALCFVFKFRSTYKVPNPMGCTPDKDIYSHYNIPFCLVLSVLYVYATSTSLQIISWFNYSYLRAAFQFQMFCIASKMTNEFLIREGVCRFQIAVVKCSRNSLCKEMKSPLHVVKRAEIWYHFSPRNILHRGSWRHLENTMAR